MENQCPKCGATLRSEFNRELHTPDSPYCQELQIANLTAERDKLGAQAVSAVEAVCVLHKEKAAILAERDRLKGLLAKYQWGAVRCPCCFRIEQTGHFDGCEIAEALK